MKTYVDTSVLVAYYCLEPLSEKAESFLLDQSRPAVSDLTQVEVLSALSRKVRERELPRKEAVRVAGKFLAHLNEGFYSCLPVESRHYSLARDWVSLFRLNLRTLDGLHLAVASSEGLTLVTSDRGLYKSARSRSLDAFFLS